jgi:hypothetical protein
LRQFLEQIGLPAAAVADIPDQLGLLLQQGAEAKLVREELRRGVIEQMGLRDRPVLDRYQGEVFRLRSTSGWSYWARQAPAKRRP